MSKTEMQGSVSRKRYSAEYKSEALALAERIGVSAAARELGLHDSQLYAWRTRARLERDRSAVERELAAEGTVGGGRGQQRHLLFSGVGVSRHTDVVPQPGSRLHESIHFHMLFLDGVYIEGADGAVRSRPVGAPTHAELTQLTDTFSRDVWGGVWSGRGGLHKMPRTPIWRATTSRPGRRQN